MEEKIKQIISDLTSDKLIEVSILPKRSKFCEVTYNSNSELFERIWKEAQKELLQELKKDFAEGNPAEHICMKFIDKLKTTHNETYTNQRKD